MRFLTLIRWPNIVLTALGVLVGALWAWSAHTSASGSNPAPAASPVYVSASLLGAMGAALGLAVAANAWNAVVDRAIDARGHPDWPIPGGTVTPRSATVIAAAASVLAIGCSANVSGWLILTTATALGLLLIYSPLKQRSGLAANALAAVLASSPFLYGAWAAGVPTRGLTLMAAAIPMHFAREVAKDIRDVGADAPDRRTLPLAIGLGGSRRIVAWASGIAILALGALIAVWPKTAWGLVPAAIACALGAWRTLGGHSDAPGWYKAGMAGAIAGLLAVAAVPA